MCGTEAQACRICGLQRMTSDQFGCGLLPRMNAGRKRSLCRAALTIISLSCVPITQGAQATSHPIVTLLQGSDSRAIVLANRQAEIEHFVDFQVEPAQPYNILKDGSTIAIVVSATTYLRGLGANRICVVGWIKLPLYRRAPSLITLGSGLSIDCTAIAEMGIVENTPHVLVGVVTREGPTGKLTPHVLELTSGGLFANQIFSSRNVAELPTDLIGMRHFISRYSTKAPFLSGPPAQVWAGSPNSPGGTLELIEDPDGSRSANFNIFSNGCIGSVSGPATESPHEISITGDVEQGFPPDCTINFRRVRDHLIYDSVTKSCAISGGTGCDLFDDSLDLERNHSVPAASSTAGLDYYIRHHLP